MKFVTARELRLKPADVWSALQKEGDLVVTVNGRPKAILAGPGDGVGKTLRALRQARAIAAVEEMRRISAEKGLDKLSMREIDQIIQKVRRDKTL